MAKKKIRRSDVAFRNAYIELLMKEENDKIFVRTICEKAGYSAMCFYQNYVNKEVFSQAIVDEEVDFYIENLLEFSRLIRNGMATKEECIKCKKKFFDRVYENQDLYRCIFFNKLMPDTDHYFEEKIGQSIIDSTKNAEADTEPDNDLRFSAKQIAGVCNNQKEYLLWFIVRNRVIRYLLAERWMINNFNLSSEEISETFYDMMLMLDGGTIVTKYT